MFIELEYKYRASDTTFKPFLKLMEELGYESRVDVSSWDVYYTKPEKSDRFLRFRKSSQTPELTKKIKINANNNWERVEIDLPLDPKRINEETVEKFAAIDNYSENFRIYKSCYIFFSKDVNFVYYIVLDENLKEKGRFIEVEVNKDRVDGLVDPKWTLKKAEEKLEKIGITHQNRLKKSLFEIYERKSNESETISVIHNNVLAKS